MFDRRMMPNIAFKTNFNNVLIQLASARGNFNYLMQNTCVIDRIVTIQLNYTNGYVLSNVEE